MLKMGNNPVDRPSTRNPRMQRNGERSQKSNHNEGSLGETEQQELSPHSKKLQDEIKGGFDFPADSD